MLDLNKLFWLNNQYTLLYLFKMLQVFNQQMQDFTQLKYFNKFSSFNISCVAINELFGNIRTRGYASDIIVSVFQFSHVSWSDIILFLSTFIKSWLCILLYSAPKGQP